LRYGFDGVAYRTFTAPAPAVKEASLGALEHMGIVLDSIGSFEGGELIFARSEHRTIEIEPISVKATRVRHRGEKREPLLRHRDRCGNCRANRAAARLRRNTCRLFEDGCEESHGR
jgi:hypothetical protein